MSILRCESLTRSYVSGGREITVLRDTTFDLEPGGFLAITGPSGSGKSTLLGLLAGLDRPTRGRVVLDGHDLAALTEDERARVRAEAVGFVFQSFHLIPTLTARENIQVPLELRGEDGRARAEELLARVGLGDRGHHYPAQLSGGEQQRVAVARAFAHRPKILFADEPTGNLDAANGAERDRPPRRAEPRARDDARPGDPRPRPRAARPPRHPAARRRRRRGLRPPAQARCRNGPRAQRDSLPRATGLGVGAASSSLCAWRESRASAPPGAAHRPLGGDRRRRPRRHQLLHRQPARVGAARGAGAARRRPRALLRLSLLRRPPRRSSRELRRATSPAAEVARVVSFGGHGPQAGRPDDTARPGAGRRSRLPVLRRDRDGARRRVGAPRRDGRRGRRRLAARRPRRLDRATRSPSARRASSCGPRSRTCRATWACAAPSARASSSPARASRRPGS